MNKFKVPDYWFWKNFFNKKEILDLNKSINKHKLTEKLVGQDPKAGNSIKTSKVYWVCYKNIKDKIEKLIDNILDVNQHNFGYNLFEIRNPLLNYNIYNKGGEYSFHCDSSTSPTHDIKLTLLINISTKQYTGGEFCLLKTETPSFISDFTEPGDVILLRSHLLHKVNPVKNGTRESLTMFLKGTKFI